MTTTEAPPAFVFAGGFVNTLKKWVLFALPLRLRLKLANVIGWPRVVRVVREDRGAAARPRMGARRDRFGWRYFVVVPEGFREFWDKRSALTFYIERGGRIEDIGK